jgi:hypothetical protein
MKKDYLITLMLLCFHSSLVFGTVFRVNNQHTSDPDQRLFATLEEAHNFAKSGDTLMVEGSPLEYASVTLTKRLVVIGTGYFLSENSQTNASILSSVVRQIALKEGSEGSFLIGLSFSTGLSNYAPYIEANDIAIMRCYLTSSVQLIGSRKNIKFLQNYFNSGTINVGLSNYTFSDVELMNNVIRNNISITLSNHLVFSRVENNIFFGNVTLSTSSFRNNIIASTTAKIDVVSQNIQNNMVLGPQLSGNGNQTYSAPQLFVGEEGNSTDGQYQIKSDSPYKTAGFGNTEPGIFGGKTPYALSGLPPSPTLYEFSADSFGTKEGGLSIQLKAKSNL